MPSLTTATRTNLVSRSFYLLLAVVLIHGRRDVCLVRNAQPLISGTVSAAIRHQLSVCLVALLQMIKDNLAIKVRRNRKIFLRSLLPGVDYSDAVLHIHVLSYLE